MSSLPNLSDVDNALSLAGTVMSGAEAHGLLCGMICASGSADLTSWRRCVLGDETLPSLSLEDVDAALTSLHSVTGEQINDALAEFHLLLPDEDDSFVSRVNALAGWCQGFILGLAEGGISRDTQLPENSDEIVRDLVSISRAVAEDDLELAEQDEADYMELVEYVRTGVLLINEELHPLKANRTIQ